LEDREKIAEEHLPFLLPYFHALLDPARLPVILARLGAGGSASIKADAVQAQFCVHSISQLGRYGAIPPGAFLDLWGHVWPWIEFLAKYDDNLSMDEIIPPWARYASYMSLMRCLDDDAAVEQLRRSTVGLYVVVGRAWRHLIDRKEQTASEGIAYVSHFIGWRHKISSNSQAFEDLMIGTGGTPTGLAAIVVSHIKFFFPDPDSCVTDYTISCLGGVLCLVAPQKVPGPRDIVFKDALLSHGLIAAVITAARALCRSTLACASFEVTAIFLTVVIQLTSCPTMWIPEALRAGLLEILFTSHHRKYISSGFVTLLRDVLSPATVYHSVLSELQTSFPQVRNRKAGAIFEDPGLLVYWDRFVQLVEIRLPILDDYNAGVLMATRVCDNLEVCCIFGEYPDFLRSRSLVRQNLHQGGAQTLWCLPRCVLLFPIMPSQ
jgi:hypothetical protein